MTQCSMLKSEGGVHRMRDWLRGLQTRHVLVLAGIGLLAMVIVLVFVRRLVGIDG